MELLMCTTCGSEHHDDHPHDHRRGQLIALDQDVLGKNDRLAASNRALLARRHIVAFNVMSAPGSGKTTLLEALIGRLSDRIPMTVIEGDQETDRDAARIRASGCRVVQI